jgi:hypothetical protein
MWLLTVGEYADEMALGVVRASDIAEARRVAGEMTINRVSRGESDDMCYVSVTEVEDLTPQDEQHESAADFAEFREQHYVETGEEL